MADYEYVKRLCFGLLEIMLKLTEDVDWHQYDNCYSKNLPLRKKFFLNRLASFL